ncbi:glycoside hydrolase family 30 protein [Sunxiuqinia dokdonensis]|uniref:Glucosylceramidase n=1 Tax=Sunxiuqinia dokdonensis TaxID=1409788 RepID=A0A0L8VC49_9BACT|nr:glycoside hydrolase family 30 beta sandwich domain-containing protein [Sunxiuqinia dokdonensis]KOH45933.1 glucosylceramidase [Sunxiuqinia dokdonensis]
MNQRAIPFYFLLLFSIFFCVNCTEKASQPAAELWLSTRDGQLKFQRQSEPILFDQSNRATEKILEVNPAVRYQTMDGFGFSLTGGSAYHIHRLGDVTRAALLEELFATQDTNIGISYLRVSIGASDLDDRVFSYNDLSSGETDPDLVNFDLGPDKVHLIPLLKEILAVNPSIKIMGSPWSPPVWMKDNQHSIGGSLLPEFYESYANYFVKYIQAMEAEGIPIDAITVQNEPLHPGNNPSLLMLAKDQAEFIKHHLGPAFEANQIETKIVIYDHNADRIDYPLEILADPEAAQYVDGSAFHLYGGEIEALSQVHEAHPDKNLYFTEQWVGAPGKFEDNFPWHIKNLIIGASRNWCKTVLEWNLAADPNQDPHTEGGCTRCLGALTIGDEVTRNVAYYIVAHASKFVRPGSVRIDSNELPGLPNVAFETPDGKMVLIVMNESDEEQEFTLKQEGHTATIQLNAGDVATYVWQLVQKKE